MYEIGADSLRHMTCYTHSSCSTASNHHELEYLTTVRVCVIFFLSNNIFFKIKKNENNSEYIAQFGISRRIFLRIQKNVLLESP